MHLAICKTPTSRNSQKESNTMPRYESQILHIEDTFNAIFPGRDFSKLRDSVVQHLQLTGTLKGGDSTWIDKDHYNLESIIWGLISKLLLVFITAQFDQYLVKTANFELDANPFPGINPDNRDSAGESEIDEVGMRENPFKKLPPRNFKRLRERNSARAELSMEEVEAYLKAVAKKGLPKDVSEALAHIGEEFADIDVAEQRAIMERIAQANNGFNTILSKPLSLACAHTSTSALDDIFVHQYADTTARKSLPLDSPISTPLTEKPHFEWQTPSTIRTYQTPYQLNSPSTQEEKSEDAKWCDHCRYRDDHLSKECPERQPKTGKCLNCGKMDSHYTTKCPQKCRNCADSHHVGVCPLPLKQPLHDI